MWSPSAQWYAERVKTTAPLRQQAPLWLGISIGWWLLWYQGSAFVLSDDFHGYGWPGYVVNAWSIVHQVDAGYDAFRQPMHAWMLGTLGEALGSYPHAAVLLSSASMALLVLATGVIASLLAGPWAGGLAAAILPTVAATALSARAANHYPLQSALAASGVALALWASQRRAPIWRAALAGLVTGLAVAVDGRMVLFALVAVGILLLQRPLRVIAFVAMIWIGPQVGEQFRLPSQPTGSARELLIKQRPVLLRWAQTSNNPELIAACQFEPPNVLPSIEALQRPCAQAMWRHNIHRVMPQHVPFGRLLTAVAFGVALIPIGLRSWRRNALASWWMLGAGVPLALQALWVPYPDRYVLPWAAFLATIVPIALAKIRPRMLIPIAIISTGVWAWNTDPTDRTARHGHSINRIYQQRRDARWTVAPLINTDPFLDCSGLFVSVSLLPQVTSDPPMLKTNTQRCEAWIASPPANAWLATNSKDHLAAAAQDAGWHRVYMSTALQVWQHP